MCKARKDLMRCQQGSSCDSCLIDCQRAEITAKEDEIKADLLEAIKTALETSSLWNYLPDVGQILSDAVAKAEKE